VNDREALKLLMGLTDGDDCLLTWGNPYCHCSECRDGLLEIPTG
jgi:hypothetical protein